MAIRVALNHLTRYRYDRPVKVSPQVLRLKPAAHSRTRISAYSLKVTPADHFINWQQDPFGNYLARLVFEQKVRELAFEVDLIAELQTINPFDFFVEDYAEHYPFSYPANLAEELTPYLKIREQGPALRDWLADVDRRQQPSNDFLVALNNKLQTDIGYRIRMEPGVQSCEQTLAHASGSCRDSAWLLVQVLRHLGLASRFVSGYLVQLRADVESLDGPSGPDQDFTDLHAWAEVYLPGAGWLGLDPTSGLFATEGHIPLACTPDPASAAPLSGEVEPAGVDFQFHNRVSRIHEDPRVTLPYSDRQWQAIDALGSQVDAELERLDVRLTMGGEPTFVALDDPDDVQWNTAALGAQKRRLAGQLLHRLRGQFAAGGVLHYGQGKWYPGEHIPRWALSCLWRHDGKPIWRDDNLLADEQHTYSATAAIALDFLTALGRRLGVDADRAMPAYEDPLYYLWQESQVSADADPQQAKLDDPAARRNLAKVLSSGLGSALGYVLPLRYRDTQGWQTSAWPLRRERLFVLPGDSPMGLRLPLDALPEAAADDQDATQVDPFAARDSLADTFDQNWSVAERQPLADAVVRTAICAEVRDGALYLFLPPLRRIELWLRLVNAIETTVSELAVPVFLEGYEPPSDPRLGKLSISPDPGVIEVNIHPANSWRELSDITTTLYQQARLTRLATEKFMTDGRHTGTGGGNHITLGGPTAADSPLLRRPDLLRSFITYWQHHPGLSYLFSGLFVGPTSQAPRADEARSEALYELEIALQLIPQGNSEQPWMIDRVLRHLLVDLTGNTHRAEFCIDKLYSPDSAAGRQGLLELRAFEMPPHPRMALVQQLLVRSLVARFWRHPYRGDLVRWGTELHDRFMLPHYVRGDLQDISEDLQAHDFPFELAWLEPFFEFRFPRYGSVRVQDIELELRQAIEPWPVLGEEVRGSGTARFVDSSIERLQVRVSGMTDNRHVIVCNGRRIPLRATGVHGESVAGVRYRAWQPPSCLHPTIGVQVPLVFDVVDTWNGRAIAGCRYHVSHAGGRHFEQAPVNAFAAESRRVARFFDEGHSPGPLRPAPEVGRTVEFTTTTGSSGAIDPPREEPEPEYPYTLDLRR